MDNGRDLSASPNGPWTRKLGLHTSTFPVIQHHPKMTTRRTTGSDSRPPEYTPYMATTEPFHHTHNSQAPPTPQSANLLPLDYNALLAMTDLTKRAASDSLAALVPLFTHGAFSEVQFLNLMQSQLDEEIGPFARQQNSSLENLQYFASVLDRHAQQLRHCLRAIRLLNRTTTRRANVPVNDDQNSGTTDSNQIQDKLPHLNLPAPSYPELIEDYTDLLDRCLELAARCNSGMNIMMNRSVVQESRKAMEQTDRVKKLTILATFFIPLSFTASLFGMNFQELGQGNLAIWLFFPVAVPLTILSYSFYIWDVGVSVNKLTKWWEERTASKHG